MTRRNYTIWVIDGNGQPVEKALDAALIDGLALEYPTLNMHKELTRMGLYFRKMGSRRWSEAGLLRGITRWLNRAKAAQAKVVREKQGGVVFGPPAVPKATMPGVPPPPAVRAQLAAYVARAKR